MLRFLLSASSLVVLLTTTFFSPQVISARRCAVKMPSTLLQLYRESDLIYVGKFDKIEEGEPTREDSNYTLIPIEKHFSITSSLKGEPRKLLVIEETEYRYKPPGQNEPAASDAENESEDSGEAEVAGPEAGDAPVPGDGVSETDEEIVDTEEISIEGEGPDFIAKPGDTVLLFLKNEEKAEAVRLTDDPDGMKRMTADSLAAYESRIRELNEIFSAKDPSYTDIVAWLVRCAEDPHTRWEGTYELARSFSTLEWLEERAKAAAVEPPSDSGQGTDIYTPEPPAKFSTGDVGFAKNLTEGEKLILSNILLNRTGSAGEKRAAQVRGDRELIDLVKRWGDSKLAGSLLEQLAADSSDSGFNSDLMMSIATILGDEHLRDLADQYSDAQFQSDDELVEEENVQSEEFEAAAASDEAEAPDAATAPEDQSEADADTAADVPQDSAAEDSAAIQAETPSAKAKTYGELRSQLIKEFHRRAVALLTREEQSRHEN